jgi:hypothetical protein
MLQAMEGKIVNRVVKVITVESGLCDLNGMEGRTMSDNTED